MVEPDRDEPRRPPDPTGGNRRSAQHLRRLVHDARAARLLDSLLARIESALAESASADRALVGFERLLQNSPSHADLLETLAYAPRSVDVLATLFAGSQFLTDILLRNPDYVARLAEPEGIGQAKTPAQFDAEARAAISYADLALLTRSPLDALRRHQRAELLRIGAADLCGLSDLTTVTRQLSFLADSLIRACAHDVAARLNTPLDGFAVIALGKLGGQELNYSSDVDLLFLAEEDALAFQRVAQGLIAAMTEASDEGFLYRVDMRLRPWGRVGPLVATRAGYLAYLRRHARLWEKQALLKARPVAGDLRLARRFIEEIQPLLFEGDPDAVRADVHAMKQLTESNLRQQGRDWGEVKLGEGSIRDVEFVVQYLQLVHGGALPALRTGNTRDALTRLDDHGFLAPDEYRILSEGYTFLRTLEHYLQILDYRQTHTLPQAEPDLRFLARRLGFTGGDAADRLVAHYQQHVGAVRGIYHRYLMAEAFGPPALSGDSAMTQSQSPVQTTDAAAAIRRHVARLAPGYAASFTDEEIARHAALAARLDDEHPVEVEAIRLDDSGRWQVTVVGYDFLGELSIICGLLFTHGFSISDGQVFTYEPVDEDPRQGKGPEEGRGASSPEGRKIVDVFNVRYARGDGPARPETWSQYSADLTELLGLLLEGRQQDAQGELARRVGVALQNAEGGAPTLHPIDIEIDNESSDRYTILRIDTPDTIGFLYEFSNALALNGIHVAYVHVSSEGARIHDTLYVTDARGQKINDPDRQRELRAATVLVKHFTHLLPRSPNPEAALRHFHEYLGELFARPSWPDELGSLEKPEVLAALARLLGVSEFLWDDFLRMQYANLFPVVADVDALAAGKTRVRLAAELSETLGQVTGVEASAGISVNGEQPARASTPGSMGTPAEASTPGSVGAPVETSTAPSLTAAKRDALNAFKDREMFRIDMRHIMGQISEFRLFSSELTDLAEVVLEAAVSIAAAELAPQYGAPLDESGQPARFSLCALGKCGGRELGYASDIELMFLYSGSGQTTGPRAIGSAEYFEKLVIETVRSVRARREGIFEIDLQLRPYGRAGSLAVPLESFRRYFTPGGPAWVYERQALLRLRPIAGDASLGEEVIALRDAFLYGGEPSPDPQGAYGSGDLRFDVAAMRAMRERQLRHLVTPGRVNAKFSRGGLVDVEYVTQALQIAHGRDLPELRTPNTAQAMAALVAARVVSEENYARLSSAHLFLEQVINALRVVRGNSKDLTVPAEEGDEFAYLARRLGYGSDAARLSADLSHHMGWVQKLAARLLG